MKRIVLLTAIGVTAGVSLASAETLDVKTGLWEVTTQGTTTGMPPIPPAVMAQMTADQRAAMMAAMGNSDNPDVTRSCITAKTLQRGLDFNEGERNNCTRKVLSSTPRQIDMRMECSGEQKTMGTFHIDVVDRETITGNLDMVMSNGPNTMTMQRTLQGKWLGNDCGTVRPRED
jgi:hypothetical protein